MIAGYESGKDNPRIPLFAYHATLCSPPTTQPTIEPLISPGLTGAFVIHNALAASECQHLITASERMGYTQDTPVSLGREVRKNDAAVLIVSEDVCKTLFHRIQSFLAKFVPGISPTSRVGELIGLNARWRLYRYQESSGDVFRPHRDGGWTESKLDANNKLSPPLSPLTSLSFYTFLIYLNDDFEGGETTFLVPVHEEAKRRLDSGQATIDDLLAVSVPPRQGSVLVFPHGMNPLGSLLHQGNPVRSRGGVKYVARTDVLYRIYPSTETETAKMGSL